MAKAYVSNIKFKSHIGSDLATQTLSDQLETQRFSPNKQEGINTGITVRNTLRQVCNNTG